MKRKLLSGIIFISAVALSSCATLNTISKSENTGDDVYHTIAKTADDYEYIAQQPVIEPVVNDDYYYYGDYESRIKRFSYFAPFDYDDDFYYSYTPYNYYSQPAVTITANNNSVAYDDSYDPSAYDFGNYSAYDFGYGDYGGYDNFGYGVAYSTFIYGGGSRTSHKKSYAHTNNNVNADGLTFVKANGGSNRGNISTGPGLTFARANGSNSGGASNTPGLTFTRANAATGNGNGVAYSGGRPGGSNAVYPGRPGTNSLTPITINPAVVTRNIRPQSENPRPVVQQPTVERASPPIQNSSSSSTSSSSSSTSSGTSSGGGGRPVRP